MVRWRKREFVEFVTFRQWSFSRRRVNEIPAYLYPLGFGFSWVRRIRQGFWQDVETGELYVGFLAGGDNFHYFSANGRGRSEASWPEPALKPISFEAGCRLLVRDQIDIRL